VSSIEALGHRLPASMPPGARLPHVGRLLVRQAWGLSATPGEFLGTLGYAVGFGAEVADQVARLADEAFEREAEGLCALLLRDLAALAARPAAAGCAPGFLLADAAYAFTREVAPLDAGLRRALAARQMHMTANRCGLGNREEVYLTHVLRLAAGRVAAVNAAEWGAAWRARARQAPGESLAEVARRAAAAFAAGSVA
jgi:hypothetical protein